MPQKPCFTEVVRIRAPQGFNEALADAAARDLTTASEFVRRAVIEHLRRIGIDPHEKAVRPRRNEGPVSCRAGA